MNLNSILPAAARIAVLAALAITAIAVLPVAVQSPDRIDWGDTGRACIALFLGLLILEIPYRRRLGRVWQRFAFVNVQVGLWCTAICLVLAAPDHYPVSLVSLVTVVAALWITAKTWTLHQLARRPAPESKQALLPSQRDVLESLAANVLGADDRRHEAAVVQLRGRWGDGKSRILQALFDLAHGVQPQQYGARKHAIPMADVEIAYVDVWKHQTESSLQARVVRELLRQPSLIFGGGWLLYPVLLMMSQWLSDARMDLWVRTSRPTRAELSVPVQLPRLPWQRTFERAVERCHSRGNGVLIVFDEVDRATPYITQCALTLVRRSLDRDGVTAVLAYVDNIIDSKMFDPTRPFSSTDGDPWRQLPDVFTTNMAVLARRFPQYTGDDDRIREYQALPAMERRQIRRQMSEKYLASREIAIRPLTSADLVLMLQNFPTLRSWQSVADSHAEELKTADTALRQERTTPLDPPPIRQLEADLQRAAEYLKGAGVLDKAQAKDLVVAIMVVVHVTGVTFYRGAGSGG